MEHKNEKETLLRITISLYILFFVLNVNQYCTLIISVSILIRIIFCYSDLFDVEPFLGSTGTLFVGFVKREIIKQ